MKTRMLIAALCCPFIVYAEPRPISNCNDLHIAAQYSSGDYVLTNDIDCEGRLMYPIGTQSYPYINGTFDGQGYTIKNFTSLNRHNHSGLFGSVQNITVKNLYLENVRIEGVEAGKAIGALVGYAITSTFENIHIVGEVRGVLNTGGVAGKLDRSTVNNVHFKGYVYGKENTGGFVGENRGTIEHSTVHAYVFGNHPESAHTGGFVGYNRGIIKQSYSKTELDGRYDIGGFAGLIGRGSDIEEVYSAAFIKPYIEARGFAARFESSEHTLIKSYWDKDLAHREDVSGGYPRTTAEMKTQSNYVDWDFETIWKIDEGNAYPSLQQK